MAWPQIALASGIGMLSLLHHNLRHLWHQPGVVSALVLLINLAMVAFLVEQLRRRRAFTG